MYYLKNYVKKKIRVPRKLKMLIQVNQIPVSSSNFFEKNLSILTETRMK